MNIISGLTSAAVYLVPYPSSLRDTNYIAAHYIPGLKNPKKYLATQLPLPDTIKDVWRLVTQFKIKLIVVLQPPLPSDPVYFFFNNNSVKIVHRYNIFFIQNCMSIIPITRILNVTEHISIERQKSTEEEDVFTKRFVTLANHGEVIRFLLLIHYRNLLITNDITAKQDGCRPGIQGVDSRT